MVVRWRDAIPPQSGPSRAAMKALTAYAEATDGVDVVGAWSDGTGLASIVTGVLLFGWRAIAGALARRRRA